ncbi:hypothetical protein [Peptacetobacter sp.]|uniref:hypothetical protein n=1 Tax=unclassified Peptacetobacter TaxID=2991974 RepID=UPI002E7A4295|nr:hypothetical protein [Peptacetobacter sp.]MED9947311.1 hypothetical protein [Peptacetobacter hiranonis]MEE0452609.1 hypothetical protein [Peptacetobacter sp.]
MSLAELIIGMSLVILLIGIVVPKADSGYMKSEWERRKLCSELRLLKRKNLAGIGEYMRIAKVNNKSCYRTFFDLKLIREEYVDDNIKVASNMKKIMFKSDGIPMDSGTIEIRYKKKTYTITITPISGRILFKEGIYSNDKE